MAKSEREDTAFRAAQSGWDQWLSTKWEFSDRPDKAVAEAVERWLDKNRDAVIAAIAKAVAEKHPGA